jgi:hypothetical protein
VVHRQTPAIAHSLYGVRGRLAAKVAMVAIEREIATLAILRLLVDFFVAAR